MCMRNSRRISKPCGRTREDTAQSAREEAPMRAWGMVAVALLGLGAVLLAAAQERDGLVEKGQKAFMANGCYGCHTVGKMGTPIGPDLSHVGGKYSLAYLQRWLRDPAEQRPSAHMP